MRCRRHTLCVPDAARTKVLVDTMPRLKDDTQSWDLLLRKGGERLRLSGVWSERSSSDGERERHTYDNGVVQNESCYQLYT